MTHGRLRSTLCWFGATAAAVAALLLVLDAISVSTLAGWSASGYLRLVLAALALAGMAGFMSLAFRIERRGRLP